MRPNSTGFRSPALLTAALAMAAATSAQAAAPVFFGPTAYLSAADVPAGFYAGGVATLLETLEDRSLDASLAASRGLLLDVGFAGARDAVDADDGVIDGTCGPQTAGRCVSWFDGAGSFGLTFTYQGAGPLPTAFGLVWTDGGGTITFSAVGADGQSLGSISATGIADNSFGATTGEDRFFGVQFDGGIRSIRIANSSGGIEVDHIQYGTAAAVPEPGSWALMLGGGLLLARRLARRGR
ncbi:PEP-CTERM sorting domain-containing protein [Ideonella sp. DXS22W]|uniref:PEP-CTERM sorting domain-containing protein n=1 Tax=Pseudaquabacterium inlustre TaxID=2984192 RepID=A0ABU9CN20_9BURK